jgi:hypothetical protein
MVAAPVAAQQPGRERAATTPPALAATLEDVTVLRAVKPLQLTAAQLRPLVERLEAGAARVRQAEAADGAAWVGAARLLRTAIPQAASGTPTPAADNELARVQQVTRGRLEAARRQTRDEVRALLEQTLTQAQQTALITAGRAAIARERMARVEEGDLRQADRFGRDLDRLREATPQEYPQERRRFAMQMANMPGWWDAGRDNRAGATARRPGGPPGQRGADTNVAPGVARDRLRTQRDGLQQELDRQRRSTQRRETQEQLSDPARRAQYSQFLTTADRIRAMAPALYDQQKAQLSLQLLQAMSQSRAQTASPEEALNAFIERTLLLPGAPGVLKERLTAMGG